MGIVGALLATEARGRVAESVGKTIGRCVTALSFSAAIAVVAVARLALLGELATLTIGIGTGNAGPFNAEIAVLAEGIVVIPLGVARFVAVIAGLEIAGKTLALQMTDTAGGS